MADRRNNNSQRFSTRREIARNKINAPVRHPVQRGAGADGLIEATYTDEIGRKFVVRVDEGEDPAYGLIVGPQPLDELNLPKEYMIRLHNELFVRKLLTYDDIRRRPQDVQGAITAASKLDIQTILGLYAKYDTKP